jgi:hypothetical protein
MPSGGYYCREKKLTNGIFKFDCGCEESPCNEDSSYCPGADRGPPQMDGMPTVIGSCSPTAAHASELLALQSHNP